MYENLTYRLSLRFTAEYPFKAPTVRFETPCFHPNVDTYGNICLDILKDKWSGEVAIGAGSERGGSGGAPSRGATVATAFSPSRSVAPPLCPPAA